MRKTKIAVVTGSRAEYGLLYWLLKDIMAEDIFELQLIVSAAHLCAEFGSNYIQIENDGFNIAAKVEANFSSDDALGITKSLGESTIGFAEAFAQLKPDWLIVLGDRFEILAAVQAAHLAKIPIAHLHGGELTEGAYDDAIRHAITKMSYWHFVSSENYRKRVIQMGESPDRVFNVGAIGLDHIKRSTLLDSVALEKELALSLDGLNFLVTYHPETLHNESSQVCIALLKSLDAFPKARIIFTKANIDVGSRMINQLIDEYVAVNSERAFAYVTLGSIKYLSLMKAAQVVIGNSSSGIYEAPMFKKPVVNIGNRQKGRLLANCIIECDESVSSITAAIERAIELSKSIANLPINYPYGDGDASAQIVEKLKSSDVTKLPSKHFYDCIGA